MCKPCFCALKPLKSLWNNPCRLSHKPHVPHPTTMPTQITQADLIESVAAALQYISYYHPADYLSLIHI